MDKETVHGILKHKAKKIERLCENIAPGFDHDTIHQLRVETKKLRAVMRLINTDNENEPLKLPKRFKRLYHIVGAIRDAQLEQKRITGWGISLPLYTDNLAVNIDRQKQEWEKYYSKKVTAKLIARIDDYPFTDLNPDILHYFFSKGLEKIAGISSKKVHTNDQIHTMRKLVKDMLYTAKFAEKKWPHGYEKIAVLPLSALNDLSTIIGDYNDARIMLEHLSSFSSNTMTQGEKDTMLHIRTEEMERQHTEKKKVLAQIRKYISKAVAD
jgi:CHAD domain-containing protein